jgi:hypothetical protein
VLKCLLMANFDDSIGSAMDESGYLDHSIIGSFEEVVPPGCLIGGIFGRVVRGQVDDTRDVTIERLTMDVRSK